MKLNSRPLAVTLLGVLYIAIGAVGFVEHLTQLRREHIFHDGGFWVELTEVLAILCGAFMLRGQNWARWLATGWIFLHVVLSAFHSLQEFAIHSLLCVVFAWILFRSDAALYFRNARSQAQMQGSS